MHLPTASKKTPIITKNAPIVSEKAPKHNCKQRSSTVSRKFPTVSKKVTSILMCELQENTTKGCLLRSTLRSTLPITHEDLLMSKVVL